MKMTIRFCISLVLIGVLRLCNPLVIAKNESPSRERYNFFDTELFKVLSETEPNNMLVSPVSIKLLLGMLMEGSADSTADEIRAALRLPNDTQAMRQEFDTWLSLLQTNDTPSDLKLAGQMFLSDEYYVRSEYKKALEAHYKAGVTAVSFREPKEAARIINSWVSKETCDVVPSVLDQDQIDPSTKMMLINTAYFRGIWDIPFVGDKRVRCFYTLSNKCQRSAMMSDTGTYNFGYINKLDAQALQIPYKDGKYSMLILLPSKRNKIDDLTRDLVHVSVKSILSEIKSQEVFVQIPKFEISYQNDLVGTLQKLQLSNLFGEKANFSKITVGDGVPVTIDRVFHSTKIIVNEEGTKAGAVTGALFMPLMGGTTTSFVANHPFVFFILDSAYNSIIFGGKLMLPPPSSIKEEVSAMLNSESSLSADSLEPPKTDNIGTGVPHTLKVHPIRQSPKFRSIKGAFAHRKHPYYSDSGPAASFFYSAGEADEFLQRQTGSRKLYRNSDFAEFEPVRQGVETHSNNVHLKEIETSGSVQSGNHQNPTFDSWRHHILFFS